MNNMHIALRLFACVTAWQVFCLPGKNLFCLKKKTKKHSKWKQILHFYSVQIWIIKVGFIPLSTLVNSSKKKKQLLNDLSFAKCAITQRLESLFTLQLLIPGHLFASCEPLSCSVGFMWCNQCENQIADVGDQRSRCDVLSKQHRFHTIQRADTVFSWGMFVGLKYTWETSCNDKQELV